jgi:tetratricopeptide (TPR) repeat protein
MLLKPYSVSSGLDYRDYLRQNYFCVISGQGLKKINLKGINKIGSSVDPDFKEIYEDKLFGRKFEDIEISPALISGEEKHQVAELLKSRLEFNSEELYSFTRLGGAFTIEMADIVYLNDLKSEEMKGGLEAIKDSMIFAEKPDCYDRFMKILEKYEKYLENPSDLKLFKECKSALESNLGDYDANPYAHFLLGLIYHRPTIFFDPDKSVEEFSSARDLSKETEDMYMTALCNFMLSWLYYVYGHTVKAIEHLLEAIDEEFMNIPEIYYNLAKFYASAGDRGNSIKYLDEAVERFDYFYAFKADMDEDFKVIKTDVISLFEKLRDEQRSKIAAKLAEYGVTIRKESPCREQAGAEQK